MINSVHSYFVEFTLHAQNASQYTLLSLLVFITPFEWMVFRLAMAAIQQLPNEEVVRIQSQALFSKQEEEILCTVAAVSIHVYGDVVDVKPPLI